VRTLVVDDSPIIRILLKNILAAYGECELAKDGREAIDAYDRSLREGLAFDLICLDLGLPTISGIEVLEEIRKREVQSGSSLKARVLIITASTELHEVESVKGRGADGYLIKPIVKERLIEYLTSFGLLDGCENLIRRIDTMCGLDTIPPSVLAPLLQRMAASIARQLSNIPAQSESSH
jgi:two-component system chemotaxis response regulator CheY